MYYTYTHPQAVDIIQQEDYDLLFAKVLDGLGITEMTIAKVKQMDITAKKIRITQILTSLSWDLTDSVKNELIDILYDNIFASLEGKNYADNQSGFIQLRSCAGQLQTVVENYQAADPQPLVDISLIGTLDYRDFEYIRSSLPHLQTLDLSDAICVGPEDNDFFVIPDRALFREDNETQLNELALHDSTLTIGKEAFRNCRNLAFVFLSKSLKEIGESAFRNCVSLSKLVFPKTLKTIGDSAFSECQKLKSIMCLGAEPASLGNDCFVRFEDSRLIVPPDAMDAYVISSWADYFATPFINDTGDMDNYRRIREVRKNHIGYTQDEKRAVIRMMQAMSYSDNMPHYSEEVLIFDTGVKVFDMSEEDVMNAKKMDILEAVRILIRMSPDKKEDLLKKVQVVAEADGGYTAGEKELYQILKNDL